MIKQNNKYCFVVDINNNTLSPTNTNKGWYLIRKKKAIQVKKYPMTIKLLKVVNFPNKGSNFTIGIDDGSSHVGIAIVQECTTKTHSNDAVVITGNYITQEQCNIKDWLIKPMRRKLNKFNKHNELGDFKHRDFVKYTKKDGASYLGYVTALYPDKNQFNMTTVDSKILKRYGIKSLQLMWRFNKIHWFSARDALRV